MTNRGCPQRAGGAGGRWGDGHGPHSVRTDEQLALTQHSLKLKPHCLTHWPTYTAYPLLLLPAEEKKAEPAAVAPAEAPKGE